MNINTLGVHLDKRDYGRPLLACVFGALSLGLLGFSILQLSPNLALAAMAGWVAAIWVLIFCVWGRFEHVVMAWLFLFPYYYFFSFPRDHPLFTVDRAFLLLVVLFLINGRHEQGLMQLTPDIRRAGNFWLVYVVVCLLSLWGHSISEVLGSYRLILDGVVLPAILGLYAIRSFPIMTNLKKVHGCVCILMFTIALVAGLELVTARNLFPWTGAVEAWVQSDTLRILRVDGPFESSGILCLVGTFGFFFIVYAGRIVDKPLRGAQSVLHQVGLFAALGAAFMPMNRGLVIALLVCACIDYVAESPLVARRQWNLIFGGLLAAVLAAAFLYPSVFEDRVSRGDNLYQRVAQNQQTLKVVMDHPLLGAGFNLYHELVIGNSRYSTSWHGFEAINIPHSSLLTVLGEGGVIGFFAYIAAQLFFVKAMWGLRKLNRLGWRAFLYCVLVYNIYGLDAGIGYFSDLNLFYMFATGSILQIQLHLLEQGRATDDLRHI
jgi:O-antigen ligase